MKENPFDILTDVLTNTNIVSFKEFVTSPNYCNNHDLYDYWLKQGSEMPNNIS